MKTRRHCFNDVPVPNSVRVRHCVVTNRKIADHGAHKYMELWMYNADTEELHYFHFDDDWRWFDEWSTASVVSITEQMQKRAKPQKRDRRQSRDRAYVNHSGRR